MTKKRKSKKYVNTMMCLSVFLLLCSIASIILCGLLKDNGFGDFWWPMAGIALFFLFAITAIIPVSRVFSDSVYYEGEKKDRKYKNMDLSLLPGISDHILKESLLKNKFYDADNGYLIKKVYSFLRDTIYYYAKGIYVQDLENGIKEEFMQFKPTPRNSKNICLLFFLFKDAVEQADLDSLREISKNLIINETLVPLRVCYTCVIVLVDTVTGKGYYLDINSRMNISIYAYGCRQIRKYFS